MPENFMAKNLWGYLQGQVIIHPLKGDSKDDHPQLTVLNYASVQFLFDVFEVTERSSVFRKLHILCDFLYNSHDDKKTKQNEFNHFALSLMGGKSGKK